MSGAADGQDRSEANFFKFIASVLENSLKLRLWFIFSSKLHLITSSLCSISIVCTTKILSFNLIRQF